MAVLVFYMMNTGVGFIVYLIIQQGVIVMFRLAVVSVKHLIFITKLIILDVVQNNRTEAVKNKKKHIYLLQLYKKKKSCSHDGKNGVLQAGAWKRLLDV